MIVGAGWMGFYPQEKSKPLTITSPRQAEIPGSGSSVSNAHTLGLNFLYYFDQNWAVETVIGVPPKFKLNGEGSLAGIGQLGEARQYSPTVLGRYTFLDNNSRIRPFVSAGATYVWYNSVKLTSGLQNALGATTTLPAGVSEASRLPWRTNTLSPSSSSSWRTCLLIPGCEVASACAVPDTLSPWSTMAQR